MASTTLIPVDRYIHDYIDRGLKPPCEFLDGSLRPKPMGDLQHGWIQALIASIINQSCPGFRALTELHVRIRADEFLIPDVAVLRKPVRKHGYPGPSEPVHLFIEVRSDSQTVDELLTKCREYHRWGVPFCWIVDAEAEAVWQFSQGQQPLQVDIHGSVHAGEIGIDVAKIFAE